MADDPLPELPDQPIQDPHEHDAQIVSKHLPARYTAEFDGEPGGTSAAGSSSSMHSTSPEPGESSLKLQGGDIHRDLFKTAARAKMHKRAATFHHPQDVLAPGNEAELLAPRNQLAPGGFRRGFVYQKHQHRKTFYERLPSTIEFLDLYGKFAGEDLAEDDEQALVFEEDEGEEDGEGEAEAEAEAPDETRPLLGRRKSSRGPRPGRSSTRKTFGTLLKAFVGTGIMFLPKAFNNGGILFSSITMVVVSIVTMVAFHLLLVCKSRYGNGYGEIGQAIVGSRMRTLILSSIVLSQLGFVCAGIVFVAENITSFLQAVVHGDSPLSARALILAQIVILIPLSFFRNINKLGPLAFWADVFIMIGVLYIYYFDIVHIAAEGIHESVVLFNPKHFTLTIGAAIFTFEGIGLILPIQSEMTKPERFEWLLCIVMTIITVLFTAVGALCYATFGENTQIEIINNYPQGSKLVNAVQFLYSAAVLIGTPVQLFPAIRIIESKIFASSGKMSTSTKWSKNLIRALIVVLCGAISIVGASDLDRFVSLIGSFACIPLVYIYPAFLHYKGIAESWPAKAGDIVFMIFGLLAMAFTTIITIINSFL
ncbi:hypothetical protein M426DRAFT_322668 [Hypoxylon sp. CI-4A]|nr:hypothetical protein M426DRAFT_322668 [Hypoxylon sp. CI-4A]